MHDKDLTPEIEVQSNAHEWEPDAAKEYYSTLTPEAVERLARVIERHQTRKRQNHARNPRYQPPDERYEPIPDTLRALSAERDGLKHALDMAWQSNREHIARAEAAEARLKEAAEVLRAIYRRMDYLEHFDAVINDACETYLTSIEGDKP